MAASRRMRRPADPWHWRYLKLWGAILALLFLLPIQVLPGIGTLWTWDVFEHTESVFDILLLLIPHALGIFAVVFHAKLPGRTMGAVLLGVGVSYLVWSGVQGGQAVVLLGDIGDKSGLFLLMLLLGVVFGPIAVAAGNRVQRREDGAIGPARVAGIGGIVSMLWWFTPVDGRLVLGYIFDPDVLGKTWPLALLLVLWAITFVGAASLLFLNPLRRAQKGDRLSRGLRVAAWGIPILLLLLILVLSEGRSGTGTVTYLLIRQYVNALAFMILVAVGGALVMERRTPSEASASGEELTEVF